MLKQIDITKMNQDWRAFIYLLIIYQKIVNYGAYVIKVNEYANIGSHLFSCYAKNNGTAYFDSSKIKWKIYWYFGFW